MSNKTFISGHLTLVPRVVHAFTSMAHVHSQRKSTYVLRVTRSCFLEWVGREMVTWIGHVEMGTGREEGGEGGGGKGTEVGMERHAGGGEGATGRESWLTDACRGRWGKVDRKEGGQWKEEGCCRGRRGGWTGRRGAMGRGYFCDGMPGWTYFSLATPGHPASYSISWFLQELFSTIVLIDLPCVLLFFCMLMNIYITWDVHCHKRYCSH